MYLALLSNPYSSIEKEATRHISGPVPREGETIILPSKDGRVFYHYKVTEVMYLCGQVGDLIESNPVVKGQYVTVTTDLPFGVEAKG